MDEFDEQKREDIRKWNFDFQELMEYTKNPNYGKLKCFHGSVPFSEKKYEASQLNLLM